VTDSQTPTRRSIPHVENVDLVPATHSDPDPSAYSPRYFLGLSLGLLLMILLSYLIFG